MAWDMLIKDALSFEPDIKTSTIKSVTCGVGGAGNNTITRLTKMGLKNNKMISLNSDRIALENNEANVKIVLGQNIIKGRSTGGNIDMGERIADISRADIYQQIAGNDLIFVLAGLGGGTGSGSGPIIADIARNTGALVVSIVTLPFKAEGSNRQNIAKLALEKFHKHSHTVIVIDNNKLLQMEPNLPIRTAFSVIDYLISDIIESITDTVNIPSMLNIDFSDLNFMMRKGGTSTILYGEGEINNIEGIIDDTLNSKFLDTDIIGASGAIVHVTGGKEMSLKVLKKVVEGITVNMLDNSEVKIGARIDNNYAGKLKVTTILTGISKSSNKSRKGNVYGAAKIDDSILVY
ncbi:MAG: cell division protein FtsZ [Thermoplasmata archaeon]